MAHSVQTYVLARFGAGTVFGLGAATLVFRGRLWDPTDPAFQAINSSMLLSALMALVRTSRAGFAAALAAGYAVMRFGFAESSGWMAASSGIVLAAGALLVALIFDWVAREGVLLGKFLLVGPLLGGIYLAVAPMLEFDSLIASESVRTLLYYVFVGLVTGNGVGLGVEAADLALGPGEPQEPRELRELDETRPHAVAAPSRSESGE